MRAHVREAFLIGRSAGSYSRWARATNEAMISFKFGHQRHATAASRTRIEEPGKLEFPERRLVRSHVDPLRATKDRFRLEFYADRADPQDLVGVVNHGLPLSDARCDPPVQKLRIALDVGREIEQLLGALRHDAIDLFAQHCRIPP